MVVVTSGGPLTERRQPRPLLDRDCFVSSIDTNRNVLVARSDFDRFARENPFTRYFYPLKS